MSRRYRKSRRDPGLIEIATTSDWKVSAAMAAVCFLAATVIIPALFGGSRVLSGLVLVFVPLASLMAVVFGGISLIRFFAQRPQAPGQSHLHVITPSSSARNASMVAANIRLDLMLALRVVLSRSRFITMWRTMARLLAA